MLSHKYELNHTSDLKCHWSAFSLVAGSQNEETKTLETPGLLPVKQKRDTLRRGARSQPQSSVKTSGKLSQSKQRKKEILEFFKCGTNMPPCRNS